MGVRGLVFQMGVGFIFKWEGGASWVGGMAFDRGFEKNCRMGELPPTMGNPEFLANKH